jgi:hypothetical protein
LSLDAASGRELAPQQTGRPLACGASPWLAGPSLDSAHRGFCANKRPGGDADVINLDRHVNRNIIRTDLGVEGASTIQ